MSDPERSTLAEIGKRLGRKALAQVACVAQPDTILAWYRRLIDRKFDGSRHRRYPGRPCIEPKLEALIVQMAKENSGWGYDRIVGALANLGYEVSSTAFQTRKPFHRRGDRNLLLCALRTKSHGWHSWPIDAPTLLKAGRIFTNGPNPIDSRKIVPILSDPPLEVAP